MDQLSSKGNAYIYIYIYIYMYSLNENNYRVKISFKNGATKKNEQMPVVCVVIVKS